ncbi:N-formylglutamate amidohydrolase [Rhizobiales bacterium TNE-4]|nr:N-formylglutamate amidohydrolase [Rhizobiales bacterium TNE-4]MBV1828744.1 N-formylglutamate amidohydrolase [Rhizobiales bacterium TNE-4]
MPAFEVLTPSVVTVPLVFNSPHSGAVYPPTFLAASRLDPMTLRKSEDCFVDALFGAATDFGAPLLRAHFPRAFLDVNREPYELDPRMFDGRLPSFINARSMRVAGGLGTIARIVGDQQEIYARKLPVSEALARIDGLYKPYHRALRQLLQDQHRRFGLAILIDCHSMPSTGAHREEGQRADIVLGDRFGTSAAPFFVEQIEEALRSRGYRVGRNRPYAGGFITEHYGNPAQSVHAIQIEVNRGLYMDERSLTKSDGFAALKADLNGMIASLIAAIGYGETRLAAE